MIQLTLKAKHLRLITYLLKNRNATEVFRVLSEIKDKVTADLPDTDDVTVNVTAVEVIDAYNQLTNLQEGLAAEINKEMDYMIRPQIETGVALPDEAVAAQWLDLYNAVAASKATMAADLQNRIEEGKQFLG